MSTRRGGKGPVRGTRWIDTLDNRALGSGGTQIITLLGGLGLDDIPGLTVVRTLVKIIAYPDADPTAFGVQRLMAGAGLVTGDAFAAGAVPDVVSDAEEPVRGWIFKEMEIIYSDNGTTMVPAVIKGDFRSMRKLDLDTEVFLQLTNTSIISTAFALRIDTLIRMLVKLP